MTHSGRPVLFLDVDGVLNRCGKSNQGLETDRLKLLGKIVYETNCMIVVSSTWRRSERLLTRLVTALNAFADVIGITPLGENRGREIQAWIEREGFTGKFVILDDDHDMQPYMDHWVQTESFVGLTEEKAAEAINHLI